MVKRANLFIILILLFSVMFLSVGLEIQANEVVKVVGHEYSPYQNPDKSGFQNELVREVFKAVGLDADIEIVPPLRTIYSFYNSEFLVCSDGETIVDEEKNKEFDVRRIIYWNVPIGLMYYKPNLTSAQISGLEKVEKFSEIDPTLTILSYGGYNPYNDAGFRGTVLVKSNSPQQTKGMVKSGRNELGFEVLGVTPYFALKESPEEYQNWGFVNAWIYLPQYMAFYGKDPKGIFYENKFKEGLSIIRKNGKYIDIYERLYGRNNIPKSAIYDPDHEIGKDDLKKTVDDINFDMDKFLRQIRDKTGLITKFVE